jgi:radical SAM protein with 4Fe4S-binding SPASM domain
MYAVLDKLADAGVLVLVLTGGEIFSRRDFAEIYLHARRRGFLVTLFSNATLITPKIASLLAANRPHDMEVSIYGADAAHYEGVTGIPGSFARFERGVALLQSVGIHPLMKHTVTTLTHDHVDAVREWCTSRGLRHKFNLDVENRFTGGQEPSLYRIEPRGVRDISDDLYEARTGVRRAMPFAECTAPVSADGPAKLYQCDAGRVAFFVDALGNASHCLTDREPSFSLLELEWSEVWSRIGQWVEQPLPAEAPCSGCGLRSHCGNCPARARLATGDPYSKDPYHCDVTHAAFGLEPAPRAEGRHPRPLGGCVV